MTSQWLSDIESTLLRRVAAAHAVSCFLDYDGTLTPLAPTPDQALPLDGTAALLHELATAPGMQVAVMSGRPIEQLRRLLDVPGIWYVGIHGLEVRFPNGDTRLTEGVALVRSILPTIKRHLESTVGERPGILIEDKGATIACHHRLASPSDARASRQVISSTVREYQRRGVPIDLAHGHEVVEIHPANVNRGKTACALLAAHHPSALSIYIGDDATDEDAFKLLPPQAITIRVGQDGPPTLARFRALHPEEIHHFLRGVVECRYEAGAGTRATAALTS